MMERPGGGRDSLPPVEGWLFGEDPAAHGTAVIVSVMVSLYPPALLAIRRGLVGDVQAIVSVAVLLIDALPPDESPVVFSGESRQLDWPDASVPDAQVVLTGPPVSSGIETVKL